MASHLKLFAPTSLWYFNPLEKFALLPSPNFRLSIILNQSCFKRKYLLHLGYSTVQCKVRFIIINIAKKDTGIMGKMLSCWTDCSNIMPPVLSFNTVWNPGRITISEVFGNIFFLLTVNHQYKLCKWQVIWNKEFKIFEIAKAFGYLVSICKYHVSKPLSLLFIFRI